MNKKPTKFAAIAMFILALLNLIYGVTRFMGSDKSSGGAIGMSIGGVLDSVLYFAMCLGAGICFWKKASTITENDESKE